MKRISIPENIVSTLVEEFKEELKNLKTNQDIISFERKFKDILSINENEVNKPIIYFSADAWIKMNTLVQSSNLELAWQATVEKRKFKDREDDDTFFYYIDQVYVYPQEVTATFVAADEVKYSEWSLQLPDETFNKLRFQGHSHVNMGVSPSGTDMNTYQCFLDQLSKDDFYIFMILNKQGQFTVLVYDFAQDIIFETKDCKIDVLTRTGGLTKWREQAQKQIEKKAMPAPTYPTFPKRWEDYDDEYYSQRYGASLPNQKPTGKNESEKKKGAKKK